MPEVILASASPRREELLRLLGLDFRVVMSEFDESMVCQWPPEEHVVESATGKAADIASRIHDGVVIGADTVVVVDSSILGKPVDAEDARRMLRLLSGRSHYVFTGLCVMQRTAGETIRSERDCVCTEVRFGELSDEVIDAYVATGEPLDKAGAYGIQERGSVLVERIAGDYFNVVGLPVYRLSRMLLEVGIALFR
ncbi:MAG TPA: Maf family protein [Armatimonadota bacterium]|nr:Maf family protein [Armatimonadota bacterium]